ncbi:DUF4394 domain-containing protein [Kibdelosporangium persicum]|uniref:DNA polymerase I n=1 Tax=Kibdelosporangium persicum TaxID=2698649 RepID=A0ABX2F0R8_9PSEU|nr:DUF4394 domain-containing protein [Kibdelosporangium persicum]NRN64485.1 DNA polymerase I [Kibdelosporangium persicum]
MGFKKRVAAAAVAVTAAGAIAVGLPASSIAAPVPSLPAFGILSDGTVMAAFKTNTPGQLDWVRQIAGFTGNDKFAVGIDMRVQDGKLYVVGGGGGVYTVKIPTGASDPTLPTLTKVSQLQYALQGNKFGVDFNPVADRLRIVSDTGQNLRHDVVGGVTTQDKALTLHGVTAAAYTNNDLNADTGTLLFDGDTTNDQLVIQLPPNDGVLTPVGKFGVPFEADLGADIYSDLNGGKTLTNTGFLAGRMSGSSLGSFYTFEILTGAATKVGDFPLPGLPVTDVAVQLDAH